MRTMAHKTCKNSQCRAKLKDDGRECVAGHEQATCNAAGCRSVMAYTHCFDHGHTQ